MSELHEVKQDLKEIKTDISDIKTILAVNTASLKHHMERTAANEARIGTLERWLIGLLTSVVVAVLADAAIRLLLK